LQDHPNVSRLTIPSSWRHAGILKLLQHMAKLRSSAGGNSGSDLPDNNSSSHQAVSASTTSSSTSSSRILQGAQLDCLELHFQSVCANLCEEIARLAPGVTQLQLSLDLAFELTTKQVSIFNTDMLYVNALLLLSSQIWHGLGWLDTLRSFLNNLARPVLLEQAVNAGYLPTQ
jgi:hypothetical protein